MSIRGRGGRFSHPRREENDNNCPEADNELLNEFISDKEHGRRRDGQHTRLYVTNIPTGMTEVTLRQLFMADGDPTIYLTQTPQPHGQKPKKWAFVDFPTSFSANLALKLNNAPPHYLHVSYARNADENSETEDFTKKEIQPVIERELSRGRGRGAHVPIMGRSPGTLRPSNQKLESYNNDEDGPPSDYYSNTRFQHDKTPSHLLETNDVYSKLSKTSQGRRSVTMGRGVSKIDRVETYEISKTETKDKEKDGFMTDVDVKPFRERIRGYSEQTLPFELGRCPNCDRISMYVCCNCKKWYCSTECAHDHLSRNDGSACIGRKMSFGEEGASASIETKHNSYQINEQYSELEGSNQHPESRGAQHDIYQTVNKYSLEEDQRSGSRGSQQSINTELRDQRGNNKTSKGRSGYSDGFDDERISKQRKDGENKGNHRNRDSRNSMSKANYSASESGYDEDSVKKSNEISKKSSGNNDRPFRFLGDRKCQTKHVDNGQGNNGRFQGRQNRPDRKSFNNRNSQHDNDVYVRKDNDASSQLSRMSLESDVVNEECAAICNEDEIAEVMISSATKDENVYWVYKKTSLPDLVDMLKALNEINSSIKSVKPLLDFVCAAPFKGEWYRAKIIKIFEDAAVVRFLDYGNECRVKLDELRLIPKELVSKPPLAFKIRIQGPPVKFEENEEIVVKLISQDSSGAWRVTLDTDSPNTYLEEAAEESLSFDSFDMVHIMEGRDGEYYVQLDHNIMKLVQMSKTLGQHASIKVEPKLGELCVKSYSDTWCRAKITNDNPLTVLYIDYGNSEVVNKQDLHPVPEEFRRLPAMAIKIKLDKGTSHKYLNMGFSETLSVKAVEKLTDGTFIVQVKGEKYENSSNEEFVYPPGVYSDKERNAKHVLGLVKDKDNSVWINVQKVMSSECLTGSLSLQTKSADYISMLDVSELLKNVEPNRNYKPNVGDLVMVRSGSTWCRGYVMTLIEKDFSIALVDYGKAVIIQEKNIYALPPRYHTYPVRQAVRVILQTPLITKLGMIGNDIHLTNVQKLNNGLKCTFGAYGEANIVPWRPLVEEAGLRVFPAHNNSLVFITAFHTPRSIYVQPAKRTEATMLSELLQDITYYATKALPLNRKPLCGELLCVKYKEDGHFYRAQVYEKVDENTYKVNFVDYGNTEVVSVNDMKLLPDTYKKVPCFAIKVGLKDVVAHNFTPQAMSYLNKLSLSEKTLLLMYEDSLSDVTLSEQDGKVINTYLAELMEHSLKSLELPASEGIKKCHPFTGEDVIYESWEPNSRINLVVLAVQDFRTVLGLDQRSNLLKHLFTFLTPKITEYCKNSKHTGYNPRENEVILAKYREENESEPNWYRAICIQSMRSSSYILFIDYGNSGELPHSEIRCMPPEFMDTPVALKRCSIYGLSDSLSDELKQKVKQGLDQFSGEAIVIEDNENGNSTLWVPSLYPKLQEIGVPRIDPPPGI
ncbi:uncharacterized protein isoform X3 [Rhodnius prolixus]